MIMKKIYVSPEVHTTVLTSQHTLMLTISGEADGSQVLAPPTRGMDVMGGFPGFPSFPSFPSFDNPFDK